MSRSFIIDEISNFTLPSLTDPNLHIVGAAQDHGASIYPKGNIKNNIGYSEYQRYYFVINPKNATKFSMHFSALDFDYGSAVIKFYSANDPVALTLENTISDDANPIYSSSLYDLYHTIYLDGGGDFVNIRYPEDYPGSFFNVNNVIVTWSSSRFGTPPVGTNYYWDLTWTSDGILEPVPSYSSIIPGPITIRERSVAYKPFSS